MKNSKLRELHKVLKELYSIYDCEPDDMDCDSDFSFGFSEGIDLANKEIAENLAMILDHFFPGCKKK